MLKLWNRETREVFSEGGFFTGKDYVKIAFPVESITRVFNPTTGDVYLKGVDYIFDRQDNRIVRKNDSKIPFFDEKSFYYGCDLSTLDPLGAKGFFARNRISIDYKAKAVDVKVESGNQTNKLPRFKKLLNSSQNELIITFLGDSISTGANATGKDRIAPFSPGYPDLFVHELENNNVKIKNHAVEGTGWKHALDISSEWLGDQYDLVVIAYGMNNFCSADPDSFRAGIEDIIKTASAKSKDTEFILVSSMSAHHEWRLNPAGMDMKYAEVLWDIAGKSNNIACADVYSIWQEFLERKDFYDFTGNGINHPNDYGHRIYASVLLNLFKEIF